MTIQELASQVAQAFVMDKRTNGDEFVKLKDDSPEWMTELCQEAHKDGSPGIMGEPGQGYMLPDDWRYQFIREAVDTIAESGTDQDEADYDELAYEIEADIYTHDLTGWLHSRADRYSYIDEAVEEMGHGDSVIKDIMMGQIQEKREVFNAVLNFLRERAESEEVEA